MMIGAWAGRALLADVNKTVKLAQAVGLTDVAIVANDASAQYTGRAKWEPYGWAQVIDLAESLRAVGIRPHVMVWVVADQAYLEAMMLDLIQYQPHFDSVHLDVEEPWVRRRANHAELAEWLVPQLQRLTIRRSCTAIAHTAFDLVGLLQGAVDTWIPQVYCTNAAATKWAVDSRTSPARGCKRYRDHFKAGSIECGLAGYDATPAMLTAAYESARAWGCERVWYWSLGSMTSATAVTIAALGR